MIRAPPATDPAVPALHSRALQIPATADSQEQTMHPTGSFHTRENNFDFLRFFAAALVLFAHSYPLVGRREDEPLTLLTGYEKGGSIAVGIFFVMSGYLIASSWLASSSPKSFLIKRALRIFPALIVAVLLSVFVIGPMVTQFSLGRYLAADGTWTYLQNILLVTRYELPGVFTGNIYPDVVNGSLWTLPLEVLMYIGVMILGLTGFLKRRLIFLPIMVLAVGHFWLLGKLGIESYFIKNIFKLGLLYYSGSALFPLSRRHSLARLDRGAAVRRAGGDLPHRHRPAGVLRRAAVPGALPGLRAAALGVAFRQVR